MFNIKGFLTMLSASLLFVLSTTALAGEEGYVDQVKDGDTLVFTSKASGKSVDVRLDQIDAPEISQPWGLEAKKKLEELVLNKRVNLEATGKDRYGRVIGGIYITIDVGSERELTIDVNKHMVATGHAWYYDQYGNRQDLEKDEMAAAVSKIGLWSTDKTPIEPWIWRKHPSYLTDKCGPKTTCSQMTSCEEAKAYLACGVITLDGDRNGVPCEALCKAK